MQMDIVFLAIRMNVHSKLTCFYAAFHWNAAQTFWR